MTNLTPRGNERLNQLPEQVRLKIIEDWKHHARECKKLELPPDRNWILEAISEAERLENKCLK